MHHSAKFHQNRQMVAEIWQWFIFQGGGRLPSWICGTFWDNIQRVLEGLYH